MVSGCIRIGCITSSGQMENLTARVLLDDGQPYVHQVPDMNRDSYIYHYYSAQSYTRQASPTMTH